MNECNMYDSIYLDGVCRTMNSSVTFDKCIVRDNATEDGFIVVMDDWRGLSESQILWNNCKFENNKFGRIVDTFLTKHVTFNNCEFVKNIGYMFIEDSATAYNDCTFKNQ